ncbi:MAG TPA: glycosyltransferase family 4 protein [Candidatus Dormibacteraeota bacterium]
MAEDRLEAGTPAPTRPLRIAWFGHGEGRRADGLSTYTRETVAALRARGHEVRLFIHEQDGEAPGDQEAIALRALRVKTLTVSLFGSTERIAASLDEFAPDVVHCSWSFGTLDGEIARLAKERGAAAVATFHLPYSSPTSARGRVLRGLYRYHVRNLTEYDRCVALSDDQRALLVAAGYEDERVVVIHNGVDTESICPGASQLRRRLGAAFVVAYMGRLDPEKRVADLVRAYLDLGWPEDHLLLIAGGGSQERRVRRLAEEAANVRMLGVVTDWDQRLDLLRAADVYVLPSTAEGLALSLLEAMSVGCAVIATDVGEDGGALEDVGILLPVNPLQPTLGQALTQLRGDPALRAELGRRARRRCIERYALAASVDRLLATYATLTGAAVGV